jgi:hypothetical protein
MEFLRVAGVDYGPHVMQCFASSDVSPIFRGLVIGTEVVGIGGSVARLRFRVSRYLDERARDGGIPIDLNIELYDPTRAGDAGGLDLLTLPWSAALRTGEQTETEVTLEVEVSRRSGSARRASMPL